MRVSTFLETEFVTFGIVYLISWLRRRLLITLEDCLIKLICLRLWCCNDCVCIICFVLFCFLFFFVLGMCEWLNSPLCSVIMFIKLCLLAYTPHVWQFRWVKLSLIKIDLSIYFTTFLANKCTIFILFISLQQRPLCACAESLISRWMRAHSITIVRVTWMLVEYCGRGVCR